MAANTSSRRSFGCGFCSIDGFETFPALEEHVNFEHGQDDEVQILKEIPLTEEDNKKEEPRRASKRKKGRSFEERKAFIEGYVKLPKKK